MYRPENQIPEVLEILIIQSFYGWVHHMVSSMLSNTVWFLIKILFNPVLACNIFLNDHIIFTEE